MTLALKPFLLRFVLELLYNCHDFTQSLCVSRTALSVGMRCTLRCQFRAKGDSLIFNMIMIFAYEPEPSRYRLRKKKKIYAIFLCTIMYQFIAVRAVHSFYL